ncbi:hypothetical protein QTP70_029772, partial [Hemibagrus guttatus]
QDRLLAGLVKNDKIYRPSSKRGSHLAFRMLTWSYPASAQSGQTETRRRTRYLCEHEPWITSDIKGLLNQKKRAFMDGDQQVLKCVQRELKVHLREVKEQYKRKRNKMKKITGCSSKRGDTIEGDVGIANQ